MFKIMQLTDLHFGDLLPESSHIDQVTKALITRLIHTNQPNFIAITGDLIWSKAPDSLSTFRDVLTFIDSFNIPFDATFGNHDSEGEFSRNDINEILLSQSNFIEPQSLFNDNDRLCYYTELVVDGHTHRLYFIDSGDYDKLQVGEYDYITHAQIEWLVETDKAFSGTSQLFIHIPIPEYATAKSLGLAQGHQDEEICCPKLNTGLFSQLLLNGLSVKAMYCGHDHDNDFTADYCGIKLNYGRVTGFNTYGSLRRGGRMIELDGSAFTSYIVE
ncbi:metallophosphoesterase family protein [Macrococcoides canis]|uniref:metallophosphoesterase family protein n=1 Tax=Macrococcoides canis TaxID=1855823 RepID=UPI0020B89253|nr:metallophosphoesterase family protein [Macrococcus canis]UTH12020.1 metallophosphoesterase [Macrococcus canis]